MTHEPPRLTEAPARKALGQHFLFDPDILRRTALASGPVEGRTVIEVGPGPGGLTRALLNEGVAKLICVEADERFASALETWPEAADGRLRVYQRDARKINWTSVIEESGGSTPAMIVANLPYNVGTQLLVNWLETDPWPPFFESLTLMFQREVAERIVATPGSKAYGRLAVLSQWRSDARIAISLPPGAFTPPPKVSSAVVHLTALPAPRYEADAKTLEYVVAKAFNQRRKMLRAALKGVHPDIEDLLTSAGISPTERAEQVSLEQFCALARALKDARA